MKKQPTRTKSIKTTPFDYKVCLVIISLSGFFSIKQDIPNHRICKTV